MGGSSARIVELLPSARIAELCSECFCAGVQ
jgi:hypothetical protein